MFKAVRWMKAIYFLGGVQNCKVVKYDDLPASARYVCDAEGYSIYDSQDWQGTFYAVKA